MWPVHGTGVTSFLTFPCPSGTGLVQAACLYHVRVPNLSHPSKVGTWPSLGSYQRAKGVLLKFRKFPLKLRKNRSQIGQKSRLKIGKFFTKLTHPIITSSSNMSDVDVKPLYHVQLRRRLVFRMSRRVPTTTKSKLRRHSTVKRDRLRQVAVRGTGGTGTGGSLY